MNAFLREARESKGLTQKQVAEALGVTNQVVSSWETGQANIPARRMGRVARILGVTRKQLLENSPHVQFEKTDFKLRPIDRTKIPFTFLQAISEAALGDVTPNEVEYLQFIESTLHQPLDTRDVASLLAKRRAPASDT